MTDSHQSEAETWIPVRIPVAVKGHTTRWHSRALCLEGLQIEGPVTLAAGDELVVGFDLPSGGGRVIASGRVEQVTKHPSASEAGAETGDFTLSFVTLHKDSVNALQAFVDGNAAAEAPLGGLFTDLRETAAEPPAAEPPAAEPPAAEPPAAESEPGTESEPEALGASGTEPMCLDEVRENSGLTVDGPAVDVPLWRPGRRTLAIVAGAATATCVGVGAVWFLSRGGDDVSGVVRMGQTAQSEEGVADGEVAGGGWTCNLLGNGGSMPMPNHALACASSVSGGIQIRRGGNGPWKALEGGAALFQGDQVKTDNSGRARVQLAAGHSADVQPGAVVAIVGDPREDPSSARLRVRSGSVNATMHENTSQSLFAGDGVDELKIEPIPGQKRVEYRMTARKDGTMEVAVRKGKAKVIGRTGRSVQLAAGHAQDLAAGALKGEALALLEFPDLQTPGVDASMTFETEMRVALSWEPVKGAASYRVEVAEDQGFTALQLREVMATTSASFAPQSPGVFHWRVAARNAAEREGEFGFARRLYVVADERVDYLVGPEDGAEIGYSGKRSKVTFSWRAAVADAPYVLKVARHASLSRGVVMSIETREQQLVVPAPRPGQYYWGVFLGGAEPNKPLFTKARALAVKSDSVEHIPKRLRWR